MGSGRWSPTTYFTRAQMAAAAGKDTFDYSLRAVQSGDLRVHQTLDPQGLSMRESRDSAEHPTSNAIIISLDVTGSMGRVVRGIHDDLPHLHELLLGHKYIPDPQILFAAVGDATCDQVPLQVGQFESDNRMDENLANMILEGGGGGQKTESYELMLYVAARHTATDCWDKRQRKGYLFIIGDEMAYSRISQHQVTARIGRELQADIPIEQIIAEVKQRYHLYLIIPGKAAHGDDQQVIQFWRQHVGWHNVIQLEDPEDTSESIALTIGINEGVITMSDGLAHLHKRGIVARAIDRLTKALGAIFGADSPTNTTGSRRL